jgi:lipopolysaccharide export system ATP-binding protein
MRVERGGKVLLRDVDVIAEAGEVVGVLGPSGAGKSTLFRSLMGDLAPDGGTVKLGTNDVSAWPMWKRARAGMGYVPQSPSVLWDLSVRANLETFRAIALGESGDIGEAAKRMDLDGKLDVRAGELSAGERRRLELARAITRKPGILICDEPFAGVDPKGAARLADLLEELAQDEVAVMLADHHVAEALRVCTRALLLLDGAVALEAEPDEFQRHELVQGRYLGTWTRSIPPPA